MISDTKFGRKLHLVLRSTVLVALAALAVLGEIGSALAQNYPARPIRMLIPFAPGGATDIIARMIEPRMSRALGRQIVVDNRAGAAGNIAVELTAQAQPDGYTLLVGKHQPPSTKFQTFGACSLGVVSCL